MANGLSEYDDDKKTKQIGFRAGSDLIRRLEAARIAEDIPAAVFVRKLLIWALPYYEAAGSLYTLRHHTPRPVASPQVIKRGRRNGT